MIRIAARSSIIAIETKVNFKDSGTRLPSNVMIPRAKAISVAAGIAHPRIVTGSPMLKEVYISAGKISPPNAAIAGRLICFLLDSCRLIPLALSLGLPARKI